MKFNENQLIEALKDPAYQNIGPLPSQSYPYEWDNLFIKPFSVSHLRLISKAATLKDANYIIEAVNSVITQEASELTIGDFYYVLLWLRIHSYPKSPLVVEWTCDRDVLIHKQTKEMLLNDETYVEPEDLTEYTSEKCGHENVYQATMSTIETFSLPESDEYSPLPNGFDFPRAFLIKDIHDGLSDPELKMLLSAAQWFTGNSLRERIANMEARTVDDFTTAMALDDVYAHGFNEITEIQCMRCAAKSKYIVNLTPFSFFQSSWRKTS